ncbi:uncharacterized protein LOC131162583 [Malania oleifera]|uniref:uncharacterized protein LOC131162583 n=1 Tax=Malania oleifera TaxID=397392 RepID=UPI0025AEA6EE|nr:uncharacterized protein LOC131162583 [Malania oleifera]
MKKKYEGTSKAKRAQLQALRGDFETLHMKYGESVTDYFSRTMEIANKMRIHGDQMIDVTIIEKIPRSMTTKFNYIVCSIEESKDIDSMSIDELQSSLSVHEQKMNRQDKRRKRYKPPHQKEEVMDEEEVEAEVAMMVDTQIRNLKILILKYKSKCRTNLRRDGGKQSNFDQKEEEVSLLMTCHMKKETHKKFSWYLDTGCNNHMSGEKFVFFELDEAFRDVVKFGDGSTVSVIGKGKI